MACSTTREEELARTIEALLAILLRRGILPDEEELEGYRAYRQEHPRTDA